SFRAPASWSLLAELGRQPPFPDPLVSAVRAETLVSKSWILQRFCWQVSCFNHWLLPGEGRPPELFYLLGSSPNGSRAVRALPTCRVSYCSNFRAVCGSAFACANIAVPV